MEVLLDVAGLARSTFFYHQSRINGPDRRASLKAAITGIFTKNHSRYGHRRIHIELLKLGRTVAKKTVLKLMRSLRLVCKVRRAPPARRCAECGMSGHAYGWSTERIVEPGKGLGSPCSAVWPPIRPVQRRD
ncbi:IS3 family transposase [Arthrobacter sp. NPDC058130]|uniref:IS3 family transposase n=1 Tax=Arthrobacter sp. NPDC058130 TaxID=3346353 RepID=UPI0036E48919